MIVYLIISFIINKIISECYDRCLECTELGNSIYNHCSSCKYTTENTKVSSLNTEF